MKPSSGSPTTAFFPHMAPTRTCSRIQCQPTASQRLRGWLGPSPYWDKKDDPAYKCATTWCAPRSRPSWKGRIPSIGAIRRQHSLPARYARAITTYRHGDLRDALTQIDALIQMQPNNPYFHDCVVRRCWRAESPRRRSRLCARRCNSRITHRSSRCYLGKRWWGLTIRPIRRKQSRFCVRRSREKARRRSAIPSSRWPMAERGFRGGRPGFRTGRLPSWRQQDRARTRFARKDPFRYRHARMGQGRRYRHRQAAARPEEQLEIHRARVLLNCNGFQRPAFAKRICQCHRSA